MIPLSPLKLPLLVGLVLVSIISLAIEADNSADNIGDLVMTFDGVHKIIFSGQWLHK